MRRALAAVLSCIAIGAIAAEGDAPILWPEIKAGDRWTYRRIDLSENRLAGRYELKVTFVGLNGIQAVGTAHGTGEEIDTTWTPEWNVVNDRRTGSFIPDNGVLRFPLKVGNTYTSQFEVVRPRQGAFRARNTLTVTVVGWEEVTVPAGKFRALKIDAPGTYQRQDVAGAGKVHYTVWYVPEVKRWVKWQFENTDFRGQPLRREGEELIEYRLQ
jgi:hypothetical protein